MRKRIPIKKPANLSGFPQEKEAVKPADTIFDNQDEKNEPDTDVTPEEKDLLEKAESSMAGPEDLSWENAKLDNVDEDGEKLNEENEFSGKDLDVPGAEDDDSNEEIGEEDEENNSYSLDSDRSDV